jgi:hypothetical protein
MALQVRLVLQAHQVLLEQVVQMVQTELQVLLEHQELQVVMVQTELQVLLEHQEHQVHLEQVVAQEQVEIGT